MGWSNLANCGTRRRLYRPHTRDQPGGCQPSSFQHETRLAYPRPDSLPPSTFLSASAHSQCQTRHFRWHVSIVCDPALYRPTLDGRAYSVRLNLVRSDRSVDAFPDHKTRGTPAVICPSCHGPAVPASQSERRRRG